jgi:hypothetical protein
MSEMKKYKNKMSNCKIVIAATNITFVWAIFYVVSAITNISCDVEKNEQMLINMHHYAKVINLFWLIYIVKNLFE